MKQNGKIVPTGILEQTGCYRVRKRVNGKYVHVCNTKNYAAGLVAFDLFTASKGLVGQLNLPGISQDTLMRLLEILDHKAYKRLVSLINE